MMNRFVDSCVLAPRTLLVTEGEIMPLQWLSNARKWSRESAAAQVALVGSIVVLEEVTLVAEVKEKVDDA